MQLNQEVLLPCTAVQFRPYAKENKEKNILVASCKFQLFYIPCGLYNIIEKMGLLF